METWGDILKHSIPTTTEKPVYMPHRQIPVQLQSEVRKCLDNWLKQGIIHPSKSPYVSQVVIVNKKTGKIRLCVDFHKLNAISIGDLFPLPHVEESLQAVQAAVWFSSFNLTQGYLQMAMEEADIPKNRHPGWLQWPLRVHSHAIWTYQCRHVLLLFNGNVYWGPAVRQLVVLS